MKTWQFFALGGALFVVVLVAILAMRHDAGAFERPCVEGQAPSPLLPSARPMRVAVMPDARPFKPALERAVARWNLAAEHEVFGPVVVEVNPLLDQPDPVAVIDTANEAEHVDGKLRWGADCRILRAELHMPGLADPFYWDKLAVHELGHALGLDDDILVDSAMVRVLYRWQDNPITERDLATVRGR